MTRAVKDKNSRKFMPYSILPSKDWVHPTNRPKMIKDVLTNKWTGRVRVVTVLQGSWCPLCPRQCGWKDAKRKNPACEESARVLHWILLYRSSSWLNWYFSEWGSTPKYPKARASILKPTTLGWPKGFSNRNLLHVWRQLKCAVQQFSQRAV